MNYPYAAGDKVLAAEYNEVVKVAGLYAADAGSTDAYAITVTPAPSAYSVGMVFRFKANNDNTGSATLNVNGLGAKTIKKWGVGGKQNLSDKDIQAGQFVTVHYDGTDMQMISASQPRPVFAQGQDIRVASSGTGTQSIAHGLSAPPQLIVINAVGKLTATNPAVTHTNGSYKNGGTQGCIGHYDGGTLFGTVSSTTYIIVMTDNGGSVQASASISAVDDTNFTLNWDTNAGFDVIFNWEAYA